MVTMWVDGRDYEVSAGQVVPWLCGFHAKIDTVDIGTTVTIDADPSLDPTNPRSGVTYRVEFEGRPYVLAESWVLPWLRGLAVHHGVSESDLFDVSAADRAQRVQALMVSHQRGWLVYNGFIHRESK